MEVNAGGDRSIEEILICRGNKKKDKTEKPCSDCRSPSMRYIWDKVMSEQKEERGEFLIISAPKVPTSLSFYINQSNHLFCHLISSVSSFQAFQVFLLFPTRYQFLNAGVMTRSSFINAFSLSQMLPGTFYVPNNNPL